MLFYLICIYGKFIRSGRPTLQAHKPISTQIYVGTKYLNWPKTPPSCFFLVSDRTNGHFWLCSTSLHNPCSSSQLLDLCDGSSIVYGQIGCVDSCTLSSVGQTLFLAIIFSIFILQIPASMRSQLANYTTSNSHRHRYFLFASRPASHPHTYSRDLI